MKSKVTNHHDRHAEWLLPKNFVLPGKVRQPFDESGGWKV